MHPYRYSWQCRDARRGQPELTARKTKSVNPGIATFPRRRNGPQGRPCAFRDETGSSSIDENLFAHRAQEPLQVHEVLPSRCRVHAAVSHPAPCSRSTPRRRPSFLENREHLGVERRVIRVCGRHEHPPRGPRHPPGTWQRTSPAVSEKPLSRTRPRSFPFRCRACPFQQGAAESAHRAPMRWTGSSDAPPDRTAGASIAMADRESPPDTASLRPAPCRHRPREPGPDTGQHLDVQVARMPQSPAALARGEPHVQAPA